MKRLTKLILTVLLTVSSLNAGGLLVDSSAQDYANTLKGEHINSKYKINDSIVVETNLRKSTKGSYYYIESGITGFYNIEVNKPVKNWSFNEDVIYQSYYSNSSSTDKKRYIKFTSNNGSNIILAFYQKGFTVNDKEFKADIDDEQININVKKLDNTISILINGQKVYTDSLEKFGNLRLIDTSIINFQEQSSIYDRLHQVTLYSND